MKKSFFIKNIGAGMICLMILVTILPAEAHLNKKTDSSLTTRNMKKITDLFSQMNPEGQKTLPDIAITQFNVWYVIEKINETDSLITQGFYITVFNIGKMSFNYSLTMKLYAIWSDHEELIINEPLLSGIVGTSYSHEISQINQPSLEKPLQYRAEITTGIPEEDYENNNRTIPCDDGFRISGSIHLNLIPRLIASTMPLIIVLEDVNPRYSLNRSVSEMSVHPYEYNFTAPLQESEQQIRVFISPYAALGIVFPNIKLPILCRFFSKATEIGATEPNQHLIMNIDF